MSTISTHATRAPLRVDVARPSLGRMVVGGFFLVMGGVHLGLVAADAQVYAHFADHGLFSFVREGWWGWVWCLPALALLVWLARRDLASERRTS